jgi:hypothetical protein
MSNEIIDLDDDDNARDDDNDDNDDDGGDADGGDANDSDNAAARDTSKMTDAQKRLFALRMKLNEGSTAQRGAASVG